MNTATLLPLWVQIIIAALLLTSAIFTLLAAIGLVRFKDFYMRMHPTAIVMTLGTWCTCIASALYLTYQENSIAWYIFLLIPLFIVTAPITTAMLARAVLFRWRNEAHTAPPSLSYTVVYGNPAPITAPIKTKQDIEEAPKTEPSENEERPKKLGVDNTIEQL